MVRHAVPVAASPWSPVRSIVLALDPGAAPSAQPAAAATTAAAPTATPSPPPRTVHGGPLTFSLTGSLQMGEAMQTEQRTDPQTGDQLAQTNSDANGSAGLLMHVERRTASTTFQLALPAGVSNRSGRFGEIQAGFYSPLYALLFGSEPLSILGGVPVGQTLRGFSLQLPLRGGGDMVLFNGPGMGSNGSLIHVAGIRARTRVRNALLELGLDRANDKFGNSATDLVFGLAGQNGSGTLSQAFEAAWQRQHGSDDFASNGSALAYRADYGGERSYSSLTLRHMPNGFLSIGNGALSADDLVSAAWHGGGDTQYSISESFERTGAGAVQQMQRYGTLSVSRGFRNGMNVLLSLNDQRETSVAQDPQWLGQANLQLAVPLRSTNAIFSLQEQRSTSFSGPFAQVAYSTQVQRFLGAANLSAGYQWNRQIGGDSVTNSGLGNLALTLPFDRRTNVTFSTSLARTMAPASNSVQLTPLLTVQHLFSPVLSLAVTYGQQFLHDTLNASANGRSRIFQIQLAAPFAIGSGLVTGRADPNLPSTITGTVVEDQTVQGTLVSAMPDGVGNVAVVLDNDQVQRTDLSGRFQFNFVTPGVHTLRLETASLPRGITADQPYATIAVSGGQTGQVNFRIGTYGAIEGHLYGLNPDGSNFPVSGTTVIVDKNYRAVTDAYGAFGVGRLAAGSHVVTIDPGTLPANVSFGDSSSKTVSINNGEIAKVDFIASQLGSIAGTILYDPSLGAPYAGGVNNVYVVAEPGDHAAISDPDGTFLIDNLPPGSYTVNVDAETIEDGLTAFGGPFAEALTPGQHIEGLQFTVRKQMKAIVFSFKGGTSAPPPAQVVARTSALPPGGATTIEFHAAAKARSAHVTAFGRTADLAYDKNVNAWIGVVSVPVATANGRYDLNAQLQGDVPLTASAQLTVDDKIPLATFVITPRNPVIGQYVTVRAHFLADVRQGDEIHWLDGQITKLAKPLSGRVFAFTVKISEHPMSGLLLSGASKLPITLR